MSGDKNELDLVEDFIAVAEIFKNDISAIIENENLKNASVCVVPRSKAENSYKQSQLMFKKAISSVANQLKVNNATNAIKRLKDTKTTHNWRLENNTGDSPYVGITKDTCKIDVSQIYGKDIILVDDIYTEGVNVAEDCINELFTLGAKNVIMYAIARTIKN